MLVSLEANNSAGVVIGWFASLVTTLQLMDSALLNLLIPDLRNCTENKTCYRTLFCTNLLYMRG
jgi:hypothetical protein